MAKIGDAMMKFDPEKVTEAAATFLKLRGGKMAYLKLLKLLYIADRRAFAEWGMPVTYDNYVSMDNGPVLSQTYNLLKDGSSRFWTSYISAPEGYDVCLNGEAPPRRKMSRAEERLLESVFAEYGHSSRWDLVDLTHTFAEWENPHGSSLPIRTEAILRALNENEEDIEAILSELEDEDRTQLVVLQA